MFVKVLKSVFAFVAQCVTIDALMAHEVEGHAHAMFNKKSYALSPFKQRQELVSWFMRSLAFIALFGSVAALLVYLGSIGKIKQSWSVELGNAMIVYIPGAGLISAVWLLRAGPGNLYSTLSGVSV